jgi:outer membrane lipoprotein carrier protein
MRKFAFFVLAVAVLQAPVAAQTAPDPFAPLEAASRVYRGAAAVCSDFRQVLSVPLLGEDRTGVGRLCSRQPNKFSMRFTQPAGDLVVADGSWLWVYQPSSDAKQVLRAALATGPRGIDFYAEFLDAPRTKYKAELEARETIDGRSLDHVVLTPLRAAPYRTAELWIDPQGAHVRKVVIREENGTVRTITLSAVQANPTLAADVFSFTPPTGAQVITR